MEVKATLVEAVGKDSGKPYTCLEIQLTDTYKKRVFFEPAELELLKLQKTQNDDNQVNDFWK